MSMAKDIFIWWILIFILIFALHQANPGGSAELTKRVCQNSVLHVDCDPAERIIVKGAVFGRTRRYTEECGTQSTTKCARHDTVHLVAGECALRDSCAVSATTSKFGNPCQGIWKYLEVNYTCTRDAEVRSVCDVGSTLYLDPGDHGFLTSPNYPDNPTHPHTCTTHLVTSHGAEIDIAILQVNFPDQNTCTRNHVTLSRSPDDVVTRLCEDVSEILPLEALRNVTLQYETDGEVGGFGSASVAMAKGFSMEYTVRGCPVEDIPIPPHANLDNFRYGEWAEVRCEAGFRFRSGLTGRCVCEGYEWDCTGTLQCEVIPCDVESFLVPPHATPSVVQHGRQVQFVCQHGYVPVNGLLGSLECTNSVWTGEVGDCTEADCSEDTVSVPDSMKVALSADGQTLNFRCRYGYQPEGTLGSLLCERGNWTGDIGTCTAVDLPTTCDCHKVAFSAYLSDDVVVVTSALPVPYDVMVLNDAGSYDVTNHVFEAPLQGVYSFSWSVQGVQGMADLLVFKDDVVVGGGRTEGMVTSSGQVLLRLEVDDRVWIELREENSENDRIVFATTDVTDLPRMTFTGNLLYIV